MGNEGTVIFSAFLKGACLPRRWFQKKEICDINSPTWNGVLSSMMLSYPNTVVTTHPMFRYCIWGRYSQELASFSSETSAPYDILKEISENYKAKSLIIGEGTYGIGTTHISLTEALIKWNYNQRRINSLIYYRNDLAVLIGNKTNSIKVVNVNDNTSLENSNIPDYSGNSYIIINNNKPNFSDNDMSLTGEVYSELDSLGRCGVAFARVGKDTMPTEERGSIGMIKPSGWHTIKYDIVNGKYLYNRCHLVGYQLTGENANPKNLITCTRYMNTVGMLEFENKVASYVKKTNNHVLYRVTPIFRNDNLLATGVQIEAESIEDLGKGISFNVFVYNVQQGIEIDYKTGDSKLK